MGIAKRTHYGDYFHVRTKADPNNLAYTGVGLGGYHVSRVTVPGTMSTPDPGLHTDLPYYRYTPGTQWLHCIQQTQVTTLPTITCYMSRVTCHVSRCRGGEATTSSWTGSTWRPGSGRSTRTPSSCSGKTK